MLVWVLVWVRWVGIWVGVGFRAGSGWMGGGGLVGLGVVVLGLQSSPTNCHCCTGLEIRKKINAQITEQNFKSNGVFCLFMFLLLSVLHVGERLSF